MMKIYCSNIENKYKHGSLLIYKYSLLKPTKPLLLAASILNLWGCGGASDSSSSTNTSATTPIESSSVQGSSLPTTVSSSSIQESSLPTTASSSSIQESSLSAVVSSSSIQESSSSTIAPSSSIQALSSSAPVSSSSAQEPSSSAAVSSSSVQESSSSVRQIAVEPIVFKPQVMYAINAGGPAFTGQDGTEYSADQLSDSGSLFSADRDISATDDDALYQTERFSQSDFSYNLPIENGSYTVILKSAEIFFEQAGARVFDVDIEGQTLIDNLDLFNETSGRDVAYDSTFENIEVTDETLNITFKPSTEAAKIAAIVVIAANNVAAEYAIQCGGCHGDDQGNDVTLGGALTEPECAACGSGAEALAAFINATMPYQGTLACTGECGTLFANYIIDNFGGYNDNPLEPKPEVVQTAGDATSCEAGIDTAFGGLRRLTKEEYNRLIAQLFNDNRGFGDNFGEDGKLGNFDINVELPISEERVQQHMEVGKDIAERASENLDSWMPCSEQNDACARTMINSVVATAYRRPLSNEESDRLFETYANAKEGSTFNEGIRVLLEAVLSSPNFLYHFEFGENEQIANGVVPLTQHELAARLSFFLWRSAPDDTLTAAADAGELETLEQIAAQARRLIEDERAQATIGLFHRQWLRLETPDGDGDKARFIEAINEDTVRTVISLVYDDNGAMSDLFNVEYGFLNETSKELYDVSGSGTGQEQDGFTRYDLNPEQRKGILTRAGFLNSNHGPSRRGKFVREEVLCSIIPPPPAGVDTTVPEGNPSDHPRERFLVHTENPACGGCHRLMDPIGFGFDHYAGNGRWRSIIEEETDGVERQFEVRDMGELFETTDINGVFEGASELQTKLAGSVDAEACYAFQWVRFATGRQPGIEDSCSLATINEQAKTTNYNIQDILVAITQTDAFRYRRPEAKGDSQ